MSRTGGGGLSFGKYILLGESGCLEGVKHKLEKMEEEGGDCTYQDNGFQSEPLQLDAPET